MTYPGRWLVNASFVGWGLCALLVVAYLAPWGVDDMTDCALSSGASAFGEASRSWLPPGVTCTWDLANGAQYVDRPPLLRLLVVAMAVVGPLVSLYLRRVLRSEVAERTARVPAGGS
ncbi:hypothetical protein [Nocardioides plantarum]|uniref:Uncharacterized protein n=1 Tax=Nocardioides plantarum TaxID=29299 RepID=A0ABV5KC55_9ACTN|nr:hypothetical protein [Nocardioides plantarum]